MKGRIHSLETMGTVDGPGMRMVLFLQGCPLRCAYCHNPDTWSADRGDWISVEEVWDKFQRNMSFYEGGGITVSGGEALLQVPFLIELFRFFKERNIHTCLDTSGICFNPFDEDMLAQYRELLAVTSLVILDIKEIDDEKHRWLTGKSNASVLAFAKFLNKQKTPFWVRHVLVPGITDNLSGLYKLGLFLGPLDQLKAVDCLPYHVMGIPKYEELGLSYRLKNIPAATKEEAKAALAVIVSGIKDYRKRWWSACKAALLNE
ncbi:pyruvate formate-lyase-activating protein [Bacteroides heparinolyticus]|uniref:pyruvate formate-lyase-activating protein n=1 Tax=Prevotella heparinolytica TaxID=28113 RepID=UPI0035A0E865